MNILVDKKTVVVALIALVVGAGVGVGISHHAFNERFENDGREGRWAQHGFDANHEGARGDTRNMMDGGNMQGTMDNMKGSLEGKSGDALDAAFLSEMTVHHQGAIDMANTLLKGTKRPELIKMANDIITAQTKEIEQMKAWSATWFSATATPAQ